MKPEGVRAWRKAWRSANKQAKRGRRSTHQAEINPPRRRSSWLRRHPGPDWFAYWRENAR